MHARYYACVRERLFFQHQDQNRCDSQSLSQLQAIGPFESWYLAPAERESRYVFRLANTFPRDHFNAVQRYPLSCCLLQSAILTNV